VLLLEIQLFKMSTLRTVSFFLCLLSVHAQSTCPAPNGYFVDSSRCDKYIECHDGVAENKECPDGLLFNVEAAPFRFPCDYPQEVKCESRAQPPIAKALDLEGSCIRRWGMFRASSDAADCGRFVNCVRGKEFQFECPEGLAWHPTLWRCEWPDNVDSCDVEKYLGFSCPAAPQVEGTVPLDTHHSHPTNCAKYFVCIGGKSPRLHGCGDGLVFNPLINTCDEPINVSGCENTYPTVADLRSL